MDHVMARSRKGRNPGSTHGGRRGETWDRTSIAISAPAEWSQSIETLKPRSVGELLSAAEAHEKERTKEEARKRALKKQQQEHLAEIAREKHLESLKGQDETIWTTVEALADARKAKGYGPAIQHVIDLHDLAQRENRQAEFTERLAAFRVRHAGKRALIDRLAKAGI